MSAVLKEDDSANRKSKIQAKLAGPFDTVIAKLSFGAKHRADTYERLSRMIEKIKLVNSIDALLDVASEGGRKPGEGRAIMFAHVLFRLKQGESMADGFRPFIPLSEYLLLKAGEEAGSLTTMLRHAAVTVRAKSDMVGAVLSATAYPVVLNVAAFGYFYFYALSIVPKLVTPGMKPETWEPAARALVSASRWVNSYGWIVPLVLIALFVFMAYRMPRATGKLRQILDSVPPWSIYRVVVGSSVVLSIAAMVRSRYKLLDALMISRDAGQPWLRERLDAGITGVRRGLNLGVALRDAGHQFPDKQVIGDLIIYSQSESFEEALNSVADDMLKNSVSLVKTICGGLTVIAYINLAVILGFITIGMMSITQSLTSAVAR